MDQPLDSPDNDTSRDASGRASRMRLPQIGLSTLLLATACIATWVSTWLNQRQIERLDKRVTAMKLLTRELVVKDRAQIAVVRQQPEFNDQELWRVYLPREGLRLHLKTGKVPDIGKAVNAQADVAVAPLTGGHHTIELKSTSEDDLWITRVFVDNQPVLTARDPRNWKGTGGYTSSTSFDEQFDFPADQPVVLFHRLFRNPSGKSNSVPPPAFDNGIVLWIQ
ncbi:MAG: hypothetical protein ACTHK7_06540 [Aureliella sp.]